MSNPYMHSFKVNIKMEPFDFFSLYTSKMHFLQKLFLRLGRKRFLYNFGLIVYHNQKSFDSAAQAEEFNNLKTTIIQEFIPDGKWNKSGNMFFNDNVCFCRYENDVYFAVYFKKMDDFFHLKLKL